MGGACFGNRWGALKYRGDDARCLYLRSPSRPGGPVLPRELLKGGGKDALNGGCWNDTYNRVRGRRFCHFPTDRQFPWDHDCQLFRILIYSITLHFYEEKNSFQF